MTAVPVNRPPTEREDDLPTFELRPVPATPEGGLWASLRYTISFLRARYQRRGAIATLKEDVVERVSMLDGVLGTLGRQVRANNVRSRSFDEENSMLDAAERKRERAEQAFSSLTARKAEENRKHKRIHVELGALLSDREASCDKAEEALQALEGKRRVLKDQQKELAKQQRQLYRSAEVRDEQAAKEGIGPRRDTLRRSAQELRIEGKNLDPDMAKIADELATFDRPHAEALGRYEAAREEREAARHALDDAKEGHRHQQTDFELEKGRKTRDLTSATEEIERRLVTLGTLVNLHRVKRPEFDKLYSRIDWLHDAITTREDLVARFEGERKAYDRPALYRGLAVIVVSAVLSVTAVWVAFAVI